MGRGQVSELGSAGTSTACWRSTSIGMMSAARAWPYAVTRGATSGYQAIVAPAFLAEAGQAYVLEYASRQETREPGIVTVREGASTIDTQRGKLQLVDFARRSGLTADEAPIVTRASTNRRPARDCMSDIARSIQRKFPTAVG